MQARVGPVRRARASAPRQAAARPSFQTLQSTIGNQATIDLLGMYIMRLEAPTALLRRGARGAEVAELQTRLNQVGAVPHLNGDGVFGAQTDQAVRFFQKAHRLVVDGIVGRETNAMLERESTVHGSEADIAARGAGPCHDPGAPGPDDINAPRAVTPPTVDSGGRGPNPVTLDLVGDTPTAQPAGAQDVVVQLTVDEVSNAEALAVGGGQKPIVVGSMSALKSALQGKKVGKLAIISHSTTSGEIRFDAGTTVDTKSLSDIARELKSAGVSAQQIQFLGCNVGNDEDGLDKMKDALSAASSEGVNCFLETQKMGPIIVDGSPVDSQAKFDKLPDDKKREVDNGLKRLGEQGRGNCVIELAPGKKFKDLSIDEIHRIAFSHGGALVARFTKETGECWNELKFGGKGRCRRVQAK